MNSIPPTPTIGDKYAHWTVIEGPVRNKIRAAYWLCKCSCGTQRMIAQYDLINGRSSSCGCAKVVTQQTKQLLAARRQGQPPPRPKGSKASEETKKKMSESHKLRHAKRKLNVIP